LAAEEHRRQPEIIQFLVLLLLTVVWALQQKRGPIVPMDTQVVLALLVDWPVVVVVGMDKMVQQEPMMAQTAQVEMVVMEQASGQHIMVVAAVAVGKQWREQEDWVVVVMEQ
jgi:hypothetical protein